MTWWGGWPGHGHGRGFGWASLAASVLAGLAAGVHRMALSVLAWLAGVGTNFSQHSHSVQTCQREREPKKQGF